MYSRKEFEETAVRRGYASGANAQMYTKAYPKDAYTEDDLIDCYRYDGRELRVRNMYTNKGAKLYSDTEEEAMQKKRDSWL